MTRESEYIASVDGAAHMSAVVIIRELEMQLATKTARADAAGWQPIKTAPRGLPSSDVGCRCASEWFLGLRKDKYIAEIQKRGWPHEDGWMDRDTTTYTAEWFTHWMPLPKPPEHKP